MKNAFILFILSIAFCISLLAQTNVGIGNNSPLTKLDISGALSVREGSALSTLGTGNNNNVALPVVPSTTDVAGFCRITAPTGGTFTITGIVPNTNANGQIVTLVNTTGKAMTIANASSSSSVANRIYTQTGASLVDNASATANSSITMQYSQNAGGTGVAGWLVIATQNFITASGTIVTNNVLAGASSNAVSITNGNNQVVGGSNLTVNVAKNAVGQDGVVPGTATPANNNQVWGTNSSGVPAWGSISNAQLANSAITVSNGTGISVSGSPVSLGGTVTVTNTGVTSVGMAMPGMFNVTGSPVTTTGTLTAALASESGNTVFAAPNGSAGTPTFRALVAADVPTLNQSTTGTAANVTGIVAPANGGTGVSNAGTITNASNTTITGGGTLGLGGYTLTVPASGTAALGTGTANYAAYWSGTNTIAAEQYLNLSRGGTGASLSATGGAGQYLKQATAGGAVTVGVIATADVPTLNQSTTGNAATATNVAISGLTAATATNTIDNLNYAQTWNWSTASTQNPLSINANGLSSGTALSLASTSTAGVASSSSTLLNLARSGANANTAHTAYGVYSTVTNTNATSGTNVAGYFSASGATTANYGLLVATGNVGVGTVSPSAKFHVNGDEIIGTNYNSTTANSFASNILNIVTPTVMTTNAIAAPESGLRLMRTGTGGVKYNASAEIDLGTYAAGLAAQSSIKFRLGNGNSHIPDADIMTLQGNGNVGVGITAPAATLDVLSSNGNGIALDASSGGQGYMFYYGGTSSVAGSLKAAMALAGGNGSWSTDALPTDLVIRTSGVVTGGTGSPKQKILFNTNGGSGNSTMAINGTNVGIGDTLPTQVLDVNGTGLFRNGNTGSAFTNNQILFGYAGTATYQHDIKSRHNSGAAAGNDIDFYVWNYGTDASTAIGTKQVMTLDGTGYVGIGTTTPGALLEVSRGSNATQLTGTGADIVIQARNAATGDARLAFVSNDNTGNSGAGIIDGWANAYGGGTSKAVEISFPTSQGGASGQVNGNIAFNTNNSTTSTVTEAMRVTSTGNLQIGTPGASSNPYILPANPQSGSNATYLRLGSSSNQLQDIYTNYLYAEGAVMIGSTSSPGFPLQIEAVGTGNNNGSSCCGSTGTSWTGNNRWYENNYGGSWSGWSSTTAMIGIYCAPSIATESYFVSVSDKRIKKDFQKSISANDLATINKIQITDYKLIDSLGLGDRPFKKVVAQQVEEVYPQAVSTMKGFIPNIYSPAKEIRKNGNSVTFVMANAHGLKTGDKVRVYDGQWNLEDQPVSYADEKTFTINLKNPKDEYFVFGKEVNDFKSVDYDAISMLNVSATQEIAKRLAAVEAENEQLKCSNASLQDENSTLKSSKADVLYVNQLKAQLDDLKALMEKNGIRTER